MDPRQDLQTVITFDPSMIDGVRAVVGFLKNQEIELHPNTLWKVYNFAQSLQLQGYPKKFSSYINKRYSSKLYLKVNNHTE
jgi:hypothetical protein